MKKNLNEIDKYIRITLGIVLMVFAAANFIGAWGYLGVIILFTGLFDFCPLYKLIGFTTYKPKSDSEK